MVAVRRNGRRPGLRIGSDYSSSVARPERSLQSPLMISGERALKIETQLAQVLDVEVDELRDYLAGNVRTSSTRRTGFRFVRGTHGGHYVRDREGTDIRPAGLSVR